MFYHGYDNYMKHAFPEDEIRPISCTPLTRDRSNPAHIELNDALGNYSLTLIDNLSTLAVIASRRNERYNSKNQALRRFKTGVKAVVEQYGDGTDGKAGQGKRSKGFDLDSKVQIFETVIRGVGGLLSAHLFAIGELPIHGYEPRKHKRTTLSKSGQVQSVRWSRSFTYDGQLLRLAHDLARRLLPAFHTPTGLPYPRVNLRHGVPFYPNSPLNHDAERGQCTAAERVSGELTETCSAGAGSLVLEFTTLSRLTGDGRFEQLAKRAFWSVWDRKSATGLVGSGIDAESGQWTSPYTGVGAGIDSFYEYAAKAGILLSNAPHIEVSTENSTKAQPLSFSSYRVPQEKQSAESFQQVWNESHAAIKRHLYRGDQYTHPHYIQADLYTGAARAFWLDSLSAFYPGLLAMTGELEEAITTHLLLTALWTRYSALPERWSSHSGGVEGGLGWWGGRPEFIESTYHLHRATDDPWYLHVGEMVLRDIKRRCWARCGWSGIQDVRSGDRSDRMESFFLGETMKYLFLLFSLEHPLNKMDAAYVFSTEGHPLIIPRGLAGGHGSDGGDTSKKRRAFDSGLDSSTCPLRPKPIPFSRSATAARGDIFHAGKLARLHMMPERNTVESPLIDFSRDHPSISISDVRSPSNYTYFPWTLPLDLIPEYGICSSITTRPTFDITFPPAPNAVIGPGMLQRVVNGILINSMGGLRLGMIQDVPTDIDGDSKREQYRIQAINNIMLGKDEQIFLAKDTASNVVNPLDPNFTRVRDPVMLDLVVDVQPSGENEVNVESTAKSANGTPASPTLEHTRSFQDNENVSPESMQQVFSALIQQVASLIGGHPPSSQSPPSTAVSSREYVPAILPTGPGAAPLPDVEDAHGPDVRGEPQGSLLWRSIYVTGDNCNTKLPANVPKEAQVVVIKRGDCSFSQKLQNIPMFLPSSSSLQLVVIVSYDDEDGESDVPSGWLVRPFLEKVQVTSSGLARHHPIPLVMVAGGERTYEVLRKATRLGIKRRYSIQAQGIPISNLVIL